MAEVFNLNQLRKVQEDFLKHEQMEVDDENKELKKSSLVDSDPQNHHSTNLLSQICPVTNHSDLFPNELTLAPSCTTQNFQCSYQMEISMKHNGFMSNSTDLDFEVFITNAELHRFVF